MGQQLLEAWRRLQDGESFDVVFASVRGALYFAGVGAFCAALEALRPRDLAFFRWVLAVFNTLGMLGCFLLARRLAGSFAGGLIALSLAAVHPSFSTHTGRLYPDPVTGCLFVWAAYLYVEGVHRGSRKWMAAAGLTLTAGMFVRSQLMSYLLLLLGLSLLLTAPAWLRRSTARRLVVAFMAGALPFTLVWGLICWSAGRDLPVKVAEDNFALRQYYPYGFWQFLETDGWEGPYRLKTEPFYRALEAEARSDPDLLRSRSRQIAFTIRYVASRPLESPLLVLDNAYRLFDRPANGYRWDYPFSYPYQVALQRMILILALAGLAVFAGQLAANAGALFVPLSLAVLHGLSFPWPRYGVPALLTLIAAAGGFLGWLAAEWPRLRGLTKSERAAIGLVLGLSLTLIVVSHRLFAFRPEGARLFGWLGLLAALATPFVLSALLSPSTRGRYLWPVLVWAGLAAVVSAHSLRDRLWHQVEIALGGEAAGAEQEIDLSAEAWERLAQASEAFLALDLSVPRGDLRGVRLEVNGVSVPGSSLLPTMPRLRESTATGGRDWRGYPQWWALALTPALLPGSPAGAFRVKLRVDEGSTFVLRGDRFMGQERVYEGPSFGDWPHLVAGKLEYDGDYRLPIRLRLGSEGSRSFLIKRSGQRVRSRSVHRIRLITLKNNDGSLVWESAVPPKASQVALGFWAYSGKRGRSELMVNGRAALSLPVGQEQDFEVGEGPYRLCYRAQGLRGDKPYGAYFLFSPPAQSGQPLSLALRFRTGMSAEPLFFVIDRGRATSELAELFPACRPPRGVPLVDGAARILDASRNNYPEDTGRWAVAQVF